MKNKYRRFCLICDVTDEVILSVEDAIEMNGKRCHRCSKSYLRLILSSIKMDLKNS